MKSWVFRCACLMLACSVLLQAEDLTESVIVSIFDDATQQVTQTKLNIDHTPSVVSVLNHAEMGALGIKTLFEALSILPGVETSINQLGIKKVVIRGFDNPITYTFDKALLIVDGVRIEMGMMGNSSFYLDLPIDVIERIELLRGPGSALYGPGAFNGVINVITRQSSASGNGVFFSFGSDEYLMGGLRQHYKIAEETVLHADLYYQKNKKMVYAGDRFIRTSVIDRYTLQPIPFEREPESNEVLDDYSLAFSLQHKQWTFKTRIKENKQGNFFGWDEYLELGTENRAKQQYLFAQISYADRLTNSLSIDSKLSYGYYKLALDAQNYALIPSVRLRTPYNFSMKEKEQNFIFDTSLALSSVDDHLFTAGLYLQSLQEISNSLDDDISPYGRRAMFKGGVKRNIVGLYARDDMDIRDNLSAVLALRFDYYTKEKNLYPSAQIGLVYNANEQLNLKLNYGHAYRLPSWIQQYSVEYGPGDGMREGNPDINAETTDTFEAIAIYRYGHQHHLQGNIYYSIIDDVIDIYDEANGIDTYANQSSRSSYGVELDYTFLFGTQNRLNINFTYNKTIYISVKKQIEQTMPGVAQVMAKGSYLHYITPMVSFSTLVKYIGERPKNHEFDDSQTRENLDIDAYATVDLTLNVTTGNHWDIHVSAKNLFDADVYYPSVYNRHPGGIPREGRNFLLQTEYKF